MSKKFWVSKTKSISIDRTISNHPIISNEVKDIISYRPHWIVQKGNFILFIVVLILLSLTLLIRYPDSISGSARLMAVNAPKLVVTKTKANLIKLLVKNEQRVKAGQNLAWIQSTAMHDEVLQLKSWIDKNLQMLQSGDLTILSSDPLPVFYRLGTLQPVYQDFLNITEAAKHFLKNGYYSSKEEALHKDLKFLDALRVNIVEQKNLQEQDKQAQQKEYAIFDTLAQERIIAPIELNQHKSRLLAKQQSIKQTEAEIINSDLSRHSKRKEILDLKKLKLDHDQFIISSLINLKTAVETWYEKYVLVSSEDGVVYFLHSLHPNQVLLEDQEIFYIQNKTANYYGEFIAGQKGLGEIEIGQNVLINLESYPSEIYGNIMAKVTHIAHLPEQNDSFLITLELPYGLRTNFNKEIYFRNSLKAKGFIITKERTLFDRLFSPITRNLKSKF